MFMHMSGFVFICVYILCIFIAMDFQCNTHRSIEDNDIFRRLLWWQKLNAQKISVVNNQSSCMHHVAEIKRVNISYVKEVCEDFPIYSSKIFELKIWTISTSKAGHQDFCPFYFSIIQPIQFYVHFFMKPIQFSLCFLEFWIKRC